MTGVQVILATTDFSRSALVAVRRAAEIAREAGARLELMYVLPVESIPTSLSAARESLGYDSARMRDDAMAQLRQTAEPIHAEYAMSVELHLAVGRAHVEIAARANAIRADLVVIGAHGEHFLLDMFLGTTAQRVQRLSTVPVLVVRQALFSRYEQVLLATDFSPASAVAARAALQYFPDATFHVIHVFEAPFERRMRFAGADDAGIEDYRRQAGSLALVELDSFMRETGLEGRTASVKVRHGYAPTRIKERAAELDADLIVLGTQGKSWLAVGFLGSVSEHVATESPSDVLLVRPPG